MYDKQKWCVCVHVFIVHKHFKRNIFHCVHGKNIELPYAFNGEPVKYYSFTENSYSISSQTSHNPKSSQLYLCPMKYYQLIFKIHDFLLFSLSLSLSFNYK